MNENGHIYAPINVSEVGGVLGEGSSDIGTLCMSDKINPYSLIRPFPSTKTAPPKMVADLKTAIVGDLLSGNWERRQWGYQVPYTTSPQTISNVKDVTWYRPVPTETDHKNIAHFDGYLHTATPMFTWFANVMEGDNITISFNFGTIQEDIVSSDGKKNKGGVVSILEVFGDLQFYFGATIKNGNTYHYYFTDNAINPSTQAFGMIETTERAASNTTYEITPWICNKGLVGTSLPANARYYSLKLSEDYESSQTYTTGQNSVSMALYYIANGQIRIAVTNTFYDPYIVSNITMHIEYIRRPNYTGNELVNPAIKTETRYINESITVPGKGQSEITITGSRAQFTLNDTYPSARVWLTGRAGNSYGSGYWQESMSNMVIVTR